ncbi:MAG: ABC transporter substrate-binding protein [Actinomycetota bacterium]
MNRRLGVSLAMLAVGVGLLTTAQLAGAVRDSASLTKGGVFRVGTTGASVQVDPQLAYISTAWWLEYATAAKLYNYPDRKGPSGTVLVPEVASRFAISNGGKKYTFWIRKGFRFSDGTRVTAENFRYAIDRVANLGRPPGWPWSPGLQFINDPKGAEIVGVQEVVDERATHVSGVRVKGNRLIIRLTRPDGTFLSKITMPFFQATSTKLPLRREVVNVDGVDHLPAAGPYFMTRNDVNQLTSIRQNPFWKRGPGRYRPRNLAGVDIQWNLNEQTAFNQVKNNELDEGPLPAAEVKGIADQYGVNKTRFWSKPVNCTGYLPMNMENDLFKGNPNLRKAVAYAIDRKAYIAQVGPYAGNTWSHLFNPGVPGWRNVNPYPLDRPNLTKARQLAAGHFRDGKITVYYRSSGTINPAQAQVVRQDLINLGFEPGNITMKGFSGSMPYDPMGVRGNDADLAVSYGWCSNYPDPYDWINVLLYGGFIQAENNVNYSYMDLPKWNRKMEAAAKLVGPQRFKVYGQMDIDIMRQVAPMAVERTYNNRYFFSNRVDPKSLVYQGIYSDWSIPALALK